MARTHTGDSDRSGNRLGTFYQVNTTTRTARQSLFPAGNWSTLAWMSLMWPPGMQIYFVATNLFWSMSRIMLLPCIAVPWALGNCLHRSSLELAATSATRWRSWAFSVMSFSQFYSFSRNNLTVCCCCCCLRSSMLLTRDCTSSVRASTEDARPRTCEAIWRHLKQGHTPGTNSNSSLIAMQSVCIHDAQWQQRTMSLPLWCPLYKHPSTHSSP